MAEKSAQKSKSEDLKSKLILQFGTANNFNTWRLYQICDPVIGKGSESRVERKVLSYSATKAEAS